MKKALTRSFLSVVAGFGPMIIWLTGFALAPPAEAQDSQSLHYAETYLNSLYLNSRIQAPRLGLSALHTWIALPSRLEQWHIINFDAAASYNNLTNTLVLQPEMTTYDEISKFRRIRSLREMHDSVGPGARVSAGVVFHEMSHAEWDLYVKSGVEPRDRALLDVMNRELPGIITANDLSMFESWALASEIFAYYREELVNTIMNDTAEIKLATGLDPDTNACVRRRKRHGALTDISPNPVPYETRVELPTVWVRGTDATLDKDKASGARLKAALAAHAKATLMFPTSRNELLERLSKDRAIRAAIDLCLKD